MQGIKKQSSQWIVALTMLSTAVIVPLSFAGNIPRAMADNGVTDFNGDGYADLAIGVPGESINGHPAAGSVNVIYGSASGLSATAIPDQRFFQDSPRMTDASEDGEAFGRAVTTGDFNGDGFSDLAVGVPGENIGAEGAGAVAVIYGSSTGLSATATVANQLWTQDSPDVEDAAETTEGFGSSLATGDFNDDGYADLAIGVIEDLSADSSLIGAGAVAVIYGSASGLSATAPVADQFWTQDSPDVEDTAEAADFYGGSLATGDFNNDGYSDLAVGVGSEDLSPDFSLADAGAVNVIYGSASGLSATATISDQFWTQDSPDIEDAVEFGDFFGTVETGDFNNDGYSDLAVGSLEDRDPGPLIGAGAVNVIYGSASGLSATATIADQFWTQDSIRTFIISGPHGTLIDESEELDFFGSQLASGDYNSDGNDDLAISAIGEDLAEGVPDAGAVNVIYGSATGLSESVLEHQFWTQNSESIEGTSEIFDDFGGGSSNDSGLAAGDFNNDGYSDLAIGVINEGFGDVNDNTIYAGAVNVIYGAASGLSATTIPDQIWQQNSPSVEDRIEDGDKFGSSLA